MAKNRPFEQNTSTMPEAPHGQSIAAPVSRPGGFDSYEAVFRAHFAEQHAAVNSFYQYRPVYRYGYDLGTDRRYQHADWAVIERAARPPWEARNPATWAQFEQAIRFAWETARAT